MTNDPTKIAVPSEIVTSVPDEIEMQGLDDAKLKSMIRDAVGMTEQSITRLARLWVEAQRRRMDLSDIRFALAPLLPKVAAGRLLPRLVVDMAGQTRKLERISELPIDLQTRLADGQPVKILRADTGDVVEKPIRSLSFPEVASIMRDGAIMSIDDQRKRLTKAPERRPRKSTVVEVRLAADTYKDAAELAAQDGVSLEYFVRMLILNRLKGGKQG